MKKIENFRKSLNILINADFDKAKNDEIYRTGIIGQFNLTFELSWKALQQVLIMHGIKQAETGSPRDILLIAYKYGFIDNQDIWLNILKNRNVATHIYNEPEINEIIQHIKNEYVEIFTKLLKMLELKNVKYI